MAVRQRQFDVYLSYRENDRDVVAELQRQMETLGLRVWRDASGLQARVPKPLQTKRTALAAIIIAAAAAPNASAMVADGTGTKPAAQLTAETSHRSTGFTDELVLGKASRSRELQRAASAPVVRSWKPPPTASTGPRR